MSEIIKEQEQKEAYAKIEKLMDQVHTLISEAEKLADKFDVDFDFGLAGHGLYYQREHDWESSDDDKLTENRSWVSSSDQC